MKAKILFILLILSLLIISGCTEVNTEINETSKNVDYSKSRVSTRVNIVPQRNLSSNSTFNQSAIVN